MSCLGSDSAGTAGNTWTQSLRARGQPTLTVRVSRGSLRVTGCQKPSEQALGHRLR